MFFVCIDVFILPLFYFSHYFVIFFVLFCFVFELQLKLHLFNVFSLFHQSSYHLSSYDYKIWAHLHCIAVINFQTIWWIDLLIKSNWWSIEIKSFEIIHQFIGFFFSRSLIETQPRSKLIHEDIEWVKLNLSYIFKVWLKCIYIFLFIYLFICLFIFIFCLNSLRKFNETLDVIWIRALSYTPKKKKKYDTKWCKRMRNCVNIWFLLNF